MTEKTFFKSKYINLTETSCVNVIFNQQAFKVMNDIPGADLGYCVCCGCSIPTKSEKVNSYYVWNSMKLQNIYMYILDILDNTTLPQREMRSIFSLRFFSSCDHPPRPKGAISHHIRGRD